MRNTLPTLCLVLPLLAACEPNCPAPTVLSGQTYRVVANPLEQLNADNLEGFTAGPDYLSYGSPANGRSAWTIQWGQDQAGPVTVTIDGQAYQGRGEWDSVECGNFALEFEGDYLSEDGTTHGFTASGVFVTFDGRLAGEMLWAQTWVADDSRSGSWRARVGVRTEFVPSEDTGLQ